MHYAIRFDRLDNLLDIVWDGRFTVEDVGPYAEAVKRCFLDHNISSGFLLRMDMRRCPVQPQDAVAELAKYFPDGAFPRAQRIAIVTSSAITGMQVKRVMTQPYLQLFDDPAEGLDWLRTP